MEVDAGSEAGRGCKQLGVAAAILVAATEVELRDCTDERRDRRRAAPVKGLMLNNAASEPCSNQQDSVLK